MEGRERKGSDEGSKQRYGINKPNQERETWRMRMEREEERKGGGEL